VAESRKWELQSDPGAQETGTCSSENSQLPLRSTRVRAWLWASIGLLGTIAIVLRLVALDSDAYARLSWSSALLTDEGFYIHNARNVVLFGTARTDAFNNMLIMPTLHTVQVVVFRILGVGAVQARLISVTCSLLTLPLFFSALRRVFGLRVAAAGTLFLGLDHINLLYSRLALMDTPASALMICSLYALVRGLPLSSSERVANGDQREESQVHNNELVWIFSCGVSLGFTYATRGLTALIIPCYFLALWIGCNDLPPVSRRRYLTALVCGLGVSFILFMVVWYQPHHAEIARVNGYYIGELLVPHSLRQLRSNILESLFDYQRGTMPYLMRHSPVQFGLALAGVSWAFVTRTGRKTRIGLTEDTSLARRTRAACALVASWAVISWVFLCCVNYAPSRYFVLFYPAMAALAAFTLVEAPRIVGEIVERKALLALLGSYILCLVGQVLRSRLTLIGVNDMSALFWGIALALFLGSQLKRKRSEGVRHRYAKGAQPPEIWITGLALWAIVNTYWTGDWLLHLTYRRKAADRWLAISLPSNSTLIGAVAPGLCLNNRFKAVNVIANLCNDGPVVEQFPPPRYIVILDGGSWRERWWDERYPTLVSPSRRIHTFRNVLRSFYGITVYSVDPPEGQKPNRLFLRR
jgi:4-amino-4-deoxy-L-arabinose transferase-like glycosyltransferase